MRANKRVKLDAGRGGDTPGNLRRVTRGYHTGGTCNNPAGDSTPEIPVKGGQVSATLYYTILTEFALKEIKLI